MEAYALDTETFLIGECQQAPKLVCASLYNPDIGPKLYDRAAFEPVLKDLLNSDARLIIHNAAFDMTVLLANYPQFADEIFQAYRDCRIVCTIVYEKEERLEESGDLTSVKYSLADMVNRYLHKDISAEKDGEDIWRKRYCELDGVPVEDYPSQAARYAKQDAVYHWDVHMKQLDKYKCYREDYWRQVYADFCLRLMTVCGLRVDSERATKLEAELNAHIESVMKELLNKGLYSLNPKTKTGYSKNMAIVRGKVEMAYKKIGKDCPKTDKGAVQTDKDAMQKIAGVDLTLDLLCSISEDQHTSNNFIGHLQSEFVHPSYDVLKTTGRTSSFKPNIQQMPRKGGVRECFIPKEGYMFLAIDYSTIELCALAYVTQQVLGKGDHDLYMLNAINEGKDLHLVTASRILNVDYEDLLENRGSKEVKEARQLAKAVNFGCPGGLGAATFCIYARANYGIEGLDEERARELIRDWKDSYPEMEDYFEYIAKKDREGLGITIEQVGTDRVRAGATFTSGCNTLFQGLVADGAKDAIIAVTEDCYINEKSIAHGCAPVAFIHDEIIFEIPDRDIVINDQVVKKLSALMIDSMQAVMPTVNVSVEAALMRRWYKGAEPVFDDNGFIIPWEPDEQS